MFSKRTLLAAFSAFTILSASIVSAETAAEPPAKTSAYDDYRFRVLIDGAVVAGFSKVSGFEQQTQPVLNPDWRMEGLNPDIIRPGQLGHDRVTLERGLSKDVSFVDWLRAPLGENYAASPNLSNFRQDITVEMMDEQGKVVLVYNISKAWITSFNEDLIGAPEEGSAVIFSLTLDNEGGEWVSAVSKDHEGSTTPQVEQ